MTKQLRYVLLFLALGFLAPTGAAQGKKQLKQAYVSSLTLSKNMKTNGTLGGVSVDHSGAIFASNFGNKLWRISPGGEVQLLNTNFMSASGNSIAPDGRLIQSDFVRNRVYSVDKVTGNRTPLITSGLNGPVGVVVAPSGDIFVANCNTNTIQRALLGSTTATTFATSPLFACPNGITIAPDGNLYVVNFVGNNIFRVDPLGNVTVLATPGTMGLGGGHIVSVRDGLYVTMFNSHNLYRVSLTGKVDLLVGVEGAPGLRDGPAGRARLRYPNGIGADPTGTILYTNNLDGPRSGLNGKMRIRRILLP